MNAVILGCSSMAKAIDAAQKKTGGSLTVRKGRNRWEC